MTAPLQIAFLTGQSDRGRCALSPVQQRFLDALPVPSSAKVPWNFPYDAATLEYRDVSLPVAAWNNTRQFVAARSPAFAAAHRPSVLGLIARADRTVFLAGSCGVHLLEALALPPATLRRVHVFAYGPVSWRRPDCAIESVGGRRDWLSRACWGTPDHRVDAGHMNYLEQAAVADLCRAFIARVSASSERRA